MGQITPAAQQSTGMILEQQDALIHAVTPLLATLTTEPEPAQ